MKREHVTLLALCGKSPAVLTETVWALAHENPPVRINTVIALTTTEGRRCIESELFEAGVWQQLRESLKASGDEFKFGKIDSCIRVFPDSELTQELDDIADTSQSLAAADFILDNVRQITANDDKRLVFSLAGGRKTMSALGALCMTLLARPGDRLCHVLVPPPFDSPLLKPKFYFPQADVKHVFEGKDVESRQAAVTLHDIPFVKCRSLFPEKFGQHAGTYSRLVGMVNDRLKPIELTLYPDEKAVYISDSKGLLTETEFVLLWMLVETGASFDYSAALGEAYEEFRKEKAAESSVALNAKAITASEKDICRKRYSALLQKLKKIHPSSVLDEHRGCYRLLENVNTRVVGSAG